VDQFNLRGDYRTSQVGDFRPVQLRGCDTYNPGNLPEPAIGAGPGRPGRVLIPSKQAVFSLWQIHRCFEILRAPRGLFADDSGHLRFGYSVWPSRRATGNSKREFRRCGPRLSTTNITGMTGLGDGAGSLQKVNNNWEIDQAFSWVHDRHELKFGYDFMSRRSRFSRRARPTARSRLVVFIAVLDWPISCSGGPSATAWM